MLDRNITREFVESLPKCELHLHLEGSLRRETMLRLAQRHGVEAETMGNAEYDFEDFAGFARLFMSGLAILRDGQDFCDATTALAVELAAQNVRYAEVTTTAHSHVRRGVAVEDYVAGLNEGRRAAAKAGLELNWIVDIPRSLEAPSAGWTADLLTSGRGPDGVVALGLGGPEVGYPPELYRASFERAKAVGLRSIPHAGETSGPEAVRSAITALKADRIGHGVRAVEDPDLVSELAASGLPLEVCPTSNLRLNICRSLEEHPIKQLHRSGVTVTINSDDPAYFATTLTDEYLLAADLLDLDVAGLADLAKTAFNEAAVAPALARDHLDEIDAVTMKHRPA